MLDALSDSLGRTILISAIQQLSEDVVKNLLSRKIGIARRDIQGNTPLHIAVEAGRVSLILHLKDYLSSKNLQKESPLHTAIRCRHDQIVHLLLKMGVSTTDVCNYNNLSLDSFKLAVAIGHTPSFDALAKHGNFDFWDPQVGNLLHLALESKNIFMLKHLLTQYREETKNLINRQDGLREDGTKGISVLSLASIKGELYAIQFLKDAGANLDLQDSQRRTAAHWAAIHQQIEVLETLAHLNANLTIVDIHGLFPEDYYPEVELSARVVYEVRQYIPKI